MSFYRAVDSVGDTAAFFLDGSDINSEAITESRLQDGLRPTLSLSCLTVGIAPIAVGLSGSFSFDLEGEPFFSSSLGRFSFGWSCSICNPLPLGRLGCQPLLLLKLDPLALKPPLFSRRSNGHAFRLPRQPGRLGRGLRRAIGSQEICLCLRSSCATIGKIVVLGVLQVFILGFGL